MSGPDSGPRAGDGSAVASFFGRHLSPRPGADPGPPPHFFFPRNTNLESTMSSFFLSPKKRRLPRAASILRHTAQPADLIARVERFVREVPERRDAGPRTEFMDLLPTITADSR